MTSTTKQMKLPLEYCTDVSAQKKKQGRALTRRWKVFNDICIRLDTISEYDGQMDGRICHNNIAKTC